MAIDIRAGVTCSLGTIISGSIGDDYLQGSGLIKTQGSVLISGLIGPPMGTVVTFNYTKQGVTRDIPRKLRVLSSFADPFRRTTQVELGCKLTYASDLKEAVKWNAFNDPENSEYTDEDSAIVTLPIYASSIARKCLAKIGIISNQMPLTNVFSIAEFDFRSGYVDILSSLLVSESYFGYLNKNEVLQITSLNEESGEGPVFTSSDIIDLGPIGVGQLPGEAVTVSYSTLKLKAPTVEEADAASGGSTPPGEDPPGGIGGPLDPELTEEEAEKQADNNTKTTQKLNWELVETRNSPQSYYISYTRRVDGAEQNYVASYKGATSSKVETKYATIRTKKEEPEEEDEDEAIEELLTSIGNAIFPAFLFIGRTTSLTPEQQTEFESNPTSVLEEVWPDAEKDDYVEDGVDKWVYTGSGWELNPPTNNERFDTDPESVLSEYFPLAKPYDYVSDGIIKWISSGSGWEKKDPALEEPAEWATDGKTETKEVPVFRQSTETGPLIAVASSIAQDYLSEGYEFGNANVVISETIETFTYDDFGNQVGSQSDKYSLQLGILAGVSLNWAEGNDFIAYDSYFATAIIPSETVVTSSETIGDYTKDVTSTYLLYALTQNGQQQIAKATEKSPTISGSVNIINWIISSGLVHNNTQVTVSRKGFTTSQERPLQAERTIAKLAKGTPTEEAEEAKETDPGDTASSGSGGEGESDPNNGWSTESKSEIVLALGSAAAERRIEFSLPYAADDRFSGPAGGPFYAIRSNVKAKAMQYGRVQNRLLLGNRSGVSIQVAPDRLPSRPFSSIYIEANGLTALYRVNGASWAFDSTGIIASTDALFWAAVGGTGDFWFPVAPGNISLPSSPAVIDTTPTQVIGSIETVGTAPQTILDTTFPSAATGDGVQDEATGNFWTYNGTVWNNVGDTPGPVTTATTVFLPYNETSIYNARIRLLNIVRKFNYSLELLTEVPAIPIRIRITIQKSIPAAAGTFILANQDAELARPLRLLAADTGTFALTDEFVRFRPDRLYPVGTGVFTLNSQNSALSYSGGDPFWNEVKLLLHMDGADGSTTFTDNGPLGLVSTPTGNVQIFTAESKFNGASGRFINGRLQYADNEAWNLGSGDFTIEAWVYAASYGSHTIATQNDAFFGDSAWRLSFTRDYLGFYSTTDPDYLYQHADEVYWGDIFGLYFWTHVAVSRNGTTLRLFKDGVIVHENNSYEVSIRDSGAQMLIGGDGNFTSSPFLLIDDLRITKVCRYTANFTPPPRAFPDSGQTV